MEQDIWISALVPKQGAEVYDGIRLTVSTNERKAWEDLNEWLAEEDEDLISSGLPDKEFIMGVYLALNSSKKVLFWNVERRTIRPANIPVVIYKKPI